MSEVIDQINELSKDWLAFKGRQSADISKLANRVSNMEAAATAIPGMGSSSGTEIAEQVKGFEAFIRKGDASGMQKKGLDTSTGSGAMVPTLVADTILSKAISNGGVASKVLITPVDGADYTHLLRTGFTGAAWSGETSTRNASADATYRAIVPTHGECYAYATFSNWLLSDSRFDLVADLQQQMVAQFGKTLEAAVISGSGSSQPTGMLHVAPTAIDDGGSPLRAAVVYQYIPSGASGSLNHDPKASPPKYGDDVLLSLLFSLKPEYRKNASWFMSSTTLAAVRKFKDSTGQPIWQSSMAPGVDGGDGYLFGKPVIVSESMPVIAANACAIGCGDLKRGYELTTIHGIDVTRDDVTTPGLTKYYIRARFGGIPLDNDSIKFLKLAAS